MKDRRAQPAPSALRIAGAVASIGLILILASCVSSAPKVDIFEAGGGIIAVQASGGEGSDAEFSGRLTQNSDGCWSVETDDLTYTIVWPAGTTADQDGVRPPDASAVLILGMTIDALGGEVVAGTYPELDDLCGVPTVEFWEVDAA